MEIRNENGLVKLIPSEGMRLTDGRTVAGGRVYVGTAGAAESWREVTEAEAEAIIAERRAKMEKERMERMEKETSKASGRTEAADGEKREGSQT